MKFLFSVSLFFTSFSSQAIVGEDDRFYIHGTKWESLFSGILNFDNSCTGFLLEGDIVVTAGHCLNSRIIKDDLELDEKELEKVVIFFGDSFIKEDGTLNKIKREFSFYLSIISRDFDKAKEHMDARYDTSQLSERYAVEDVFSDFDSDRFCNSPDKSLSFARDFAFVKLKKEVPKHIKRFKVLGEMNLSEYDILDPKFQKGLGVSTVGYAADNKKTQRLRQAHLGCRIRDVIQADEGEYIYQTDCDSFFGQSGSPIFKILRHKKTGKIELGVLGVLSRGSFISGREGGRLGYGSHYTASGFTGNSTVNTRNSSFNSKFFSQSLGWFRKSPSFARNKLKSYRYKKVFKKQDIKERTYQAARMYSDEEFKRFLLFNIDAFGRCARHSVLWKSHSLKLFQEMKKDFDEGKVTKDENKKDIFHEFASIAQSIFQDGDLKLMQYLLFVDNNDMRMGDTTLHFLAFPKKKKNSPKTLSKKTRKTVYGQDTSNFFDITPPEDTPERHKKMAEKMWRIYFDR